MIRLVIFLDGQSFITGSNVAINVNMHIKAHHYVFQEAGTSRANCTQTIAFFTDGVEGDKVAEDVFDEYNRDRRVSTCFLCGNSQRFRYHPSVFL